MAVRSLISRPLVVVGMLTWGAAAGSAPVSPAIAKISYNDQIQPILAENCFSCHGPDSASRKAKLRLDHFEFATALRPDADPAIVPGKPDASAMVDRIT